MIFGVDFILVFTHIQSLWQISSKTVFGPKEKSSPLTKRST